MKKFTEIGQFRQVVSGIRSHHDYKGKDENGDNVYLHDTPYPTINFRCTVKNHGTNSGIAKYSDGHYEFQSRENKLSLEQDNAGFMRIMSEKPYQKLFDGIEFNEHCVIYGEWAGKGIQKGVALNDLDKLFIIFAVRIDDVYQDMENFKHLQNNDERIYNILQFPYWFIEIDFNYPELMQNKLVELTLAVEDECPVGKFFFNEVMINNIAYEENGKIWFDKENGFTDKLKPQLVDVFKELRVNNKTGVNYIEFNLEN